MLQPIYNQFSQATSSIPRTPAKLAQKRSEARSLMTPGSTNKRPRLQHTPRSARRSLMKDHPYPFLTPGKSGPKTPPAKRSRRLLSEQNSSTSTSSEIMATALDPEYQVSSEETSSGDSILDTATSTHVARINEDKFIVFKSQLDKLFVKCMNCGEEVIDHQVTIVGTCVTYKSSCREGCETSWSSQPVVNRVKMGNLLVAGCILFTGNTFARMDDFAKCLGLRFISSSTFYDLQNSHLLPIIQESWEENRHQILQTAMERHPQGLVLSGDARTDSPGHSGKHGAYSFMINSDADKELADKIVEIQLCDTAEPDIKNSNHMEPEGMRRGIDHLQADGVKIKVLATDRHITCASILKKEYGRIIHQFDVWHVAKGLVKKLSLSSKTKKYEELAPWLQHISNHLWWSASTCNGDGDVLREKWISLLQHIANRHKWTGNVHFHKCEHARLRKEERSHIAWLKPDSDCYELLQSHVLNDRFLKCLPQLTLFCHTGELESFHSMLLKFCPKRLSFSYVGMKGRLQCAALHWNATDHAPRQGEVEGATSVEYKKSKHDFILRRSSNKPQTVRVVHGLLNRLIDVHENSITLKPMEAPALLPRSTRLEKPSLESMRSSYMSRFAKK